MKEENNSLIPSNWSTDNPIDSRTYKLKVQGEGEQTLYFTIVGDGSIEALFINSKEMTSFQWVTALMTSYTRQLKRGIPVESVIDDMKETFDPNGKYIIPGSKGKEANSIVHHLGIVLEKHNKEVLAKYKR